VQYEQDLIHAIDGLGSGLLIAPVLGNFIMKAYSNAPAGQAGEGGRKGQ
jgi:hypothetical protein